MNKTPVYQFPFEYAYAHDECAQYNASLSANTACKEAIETAIGKYYADNCLDASAAVREVVGEFGYDRTLFVLASAIQRMDTDGRISRKNKKWARTIPIPAEDRKRAYYMVTGCSPNGTHFMAQVSPDFWARAKQKDHDRLMGMLPFASLSLSTLNGHKGIYALITRDEDRSKPLILRKPSVRKKLQEPPAAGEPKASGQNRPASHER